MTPDVEHTEWNGDAYCICSPEGDDYPVDYRDEEFVMEPDQ